MLEVEGLRGRACLEVACRLTTGGDLEPTAAAAEPGLIGGLAGGFVGVVVLTDATLEDRVFWATSSRPLFSVPFGFHGCCFLFFKLFAAATLAGIRLVGTGIFSSALVLNRVTMSLKFAEPTFEAAEVERTVGDDTLLGVCL